MKIKMLKTEKGSNDGIHVDLYEKDSVYEVGESLGKVFCDILRIAEKVEIDEVKMIQPSYENKSVAPEEIKKDQKEEVKKESPKGEESFEDAVARLKQGKK